jgi:hypothetical protein
VAKLLLLSVVIGAIVVPVLSARDANPARGLRKAIVLTLVFNLMYLFAIRFIYPRLL